MGQPHRIGVVGLGVISQAYLATLEAAASVRVVAVADLDHERARAVAGSLPTAAAMTTAELLAHPDVDTVLNLTIPAAHAEVALGAIAHGKNVYGEKPLAATLADAQGIVDAADSAGVGVGCAPDTVLGTGIQTARAAVDDGAIGRPFAASAVMIAPGHERWHPQPDFYYRPGGGPLLDMGPYYVAALIHLLGPVVSVVGSSSRLRDERTILTGPREGESVAVEVDTHITGVLTHASGALSTITTSFDGVATTAAPIEVHGELGSLSVPDPNNFDGAVRIARLGEPGWHDRETSAGYADAARGVGLIDFVRADADRPARANGGVALHSLEIMTALLEAAASGRSVAVRSTTTRPLPVPLTPKNDWTA